MKRARFWIGIGISVISLILAFKDIHLGEVAEALRGADYVWLLPAVALTLAAQVGRAARWGLLFYPQYDPPLGRLFAVLSIGYLISNLLPARLGDLARAYLMGQEKGVSVARALSTIVVERAFDVLTVVALLVALIPFVPLPDWLARPGLALGLGFLGFVGLLLLLTWQREQGLRLVGWVAGWLPGLDQGRWVGRADAVIDGFEVLRAPRPLLSLVAWSLAIWGAGAVIYHLVLQAFDLRLPPTAALFVLCVVALGAVVPSSPGYIGVFHYATIVALGVFGVEKAPALSYALVLHAVNYVVLVALGLIFVARESVSVRRLESELTQISMTKSQ